MTRGNGGRCGATALALTLVFVVTAGMAAATPTTWSLEHSPNRPGGGNDIDDVSCSTATDCVAVGEHGVGSDYRMMAMTETDGHWSLSLPSRHGSQSTFLGGVSCVSTTNCVAVGNDYGGSSRSIIETWDGASWTRVGDVPEPRGSALRAVSCSSATACTAVGSRFGHPNLTRPFVVTYDGTSWHAVKTPSVGSLGGELDGVSCSSPTQCVAVGDTLAPGGAFLSLIEMWDGTSWTVAPSADPSPSVNGLHSVSCPTATTCVAVGAYYGPSGTEPTFIEVWNGSTWTLETSPSQGDGVNWLNDVSCATSTDCVAVGGYQTAPQSSDYRTLVVTWDGATWSVAPTPDPTAGTNNLAGISCPDAAHCTAGGVAVAHNVARTLVLTGS